MSKKSLPSGKINERSGLFVKCFDIVQRTNAMEHPFCQDAFRSAYFIYKRLIEDPFFALTERHPEIFKNGHVLDIGANIGYTACTFARAISPGFKVFAFEPELHTYNLLIKSIQHARMNEKVCSIRSAVGESEGTIELWRNRSHNGDHRTVTDELKQLLPDHNDEIQSVPITSIDGFIESNNSIPIAFVKMDVQGYELPVCRGMEKMLVDNPSVVVAFEYSPNETRQLGFDEAELPDFFQSRGFQLSIIEHSGKLVPVNQADLKNHLGKRGYLDVLASRRAVS